MDDINSTQNVEELTTKVKTYAFILDIDITGLSDSVLTEALTDYVGITFSLDSFKTFLNGLIPAM